MASYRKGPGSSCGLRNRRRCGLWDAFGPLQTACRTQQVPRLVLTAQARLGAALGMTAVGNWRRYGGAILCSCVQADSGIISGAAFFGGSCGQARFLPRALRALGLGLVALFDAIVVIRFAHSAQRFVVQDGESEAILQLFGELLQRLEVVGAGRDLGLGGLQKLLVAAVDQFGDLAADQVSGVSENFHAVVAIFLEGGRHIVLSQENT